MFAKRSQSDNKQQAQAEKKAFFELDGAWTRLRSAIAFEMIANKAMDVAYAGESLHDAEDAMEQQMNTQHERKVAQARLIALVKEMTGEVIE